MKKSELKQLIKEVISESDFYSDMDSAADTMQRQKSAKKEASYSIKKEINGKSINLTLSAEFEDLDQTNKLSSMLERTLEVQMEKLIKAYNLNMKRI
jgi:hypothetical protein